MQRYISRIVSLFAPLYKRRYLKRMVKIHRATQIIFPDRLKLGVYVYIGPDCLINAEGAISIGDGSIIAPEVVVLSSSHNYKAGGLMPYDVYDEHREVRIGKGVWVGYRAMICPGVVIGDGAVVAMGAVVTKPVKSGDIVGGNPAKTISMREGPEFAELIAQKKFLHKKYWRGKRPKEKSLPAEKRK